MSLAGRIREVAHRLLTTNVLRARELENIAADVEHAETRLHAMRRGIARWSVCCGWNCAECIDTLTEFIDEKDQEEARKVGVPCDR